MFLGLIPSVKFIMKPQQTFNPHRMAADRANRKSEKYSNSRRGLSGRLKCKFVHKSLSASASCRGWIWALPVLCPQKCYTRATLLEGAGCLEWDSPHATWRRTSVYGCVCVWRGNPSLSLNEMKTEASHTHTLAHTHVCTCTDMF